MDASAEAQLCSKAEQMQLEEHPYSRRVLIKSILLRPDGGSGLDGKQVRIGAWVKSGRSQGRLTFLALNDGSCELNLQAVGSGPEAKRVIATGSSLLVEGILKQPPAAHGKQQRVELSIVKIIEAGLVTDASSYPIPKTSLPLEHLRGFLHLRSRTAVIAAASRVAGALDTAVTSFFTSNSFLRVRTPIITTSDCEGGADMFHVSASATEKDKEPFFGRPAFLTVSGQLQLEAYACSMGNVFTHGPTFRAEKSHTSRHLSEFWMVEAEMAFAELEEVMNCAEDLVKFCCRWLLDHCDEDLKFFSSDDASAVDRLVHVVSEPFARITYREAVDLLQQVEGGTFENKVEWGTDLASEHEKYLCEVYKKPVIVYNYPKKIKAFYMRMNSDGETVAAMDVLVPKLGELIGGSQREERYEVLQDRLQELGLATESYQWYMDLRKYGTVKHGGFGLGFERLVLYATGLDNIRDVIPFPRYPGKAD